ncbi:Bug family tripartite tricarboxylate transporter substrate binding protein [Comamonas testosteroni]|uniref:Bug family tripartite tricarboxylate transporter substrate binding protein n=1 Tax=Comamonas testosteroni TaxID=285 RepID=UPI0015FDA7F7|nr:tripartite tricarboxylate transporter substrate binding protein [Comamonas testosteroni]
MQRRHLLSIAALCGTAVLPWQAQAQAQAQDSANWPVKPVRMLVGSAPGGGTDAMARAVADRLGPLLKQPVIVENRPGVSNTLAVDMTAKATDGHTMVMGVVTAHAIAPHLLKLGYDNNRDLVPVAFVGSVPNVLVVGNSVAANTVAELVAMARKNPNQINFASSGTGSTQHIAAEVFKDAAGIQITHVPYKGSAAALVDLVSGQVQMSFDTMPSVIGQIKAGKLRALAVTSPQRNPQLPQVPTMAEAGLRDVEISAWYGIYMPASTPKAVQQKVHDEVNKVIAMPETKTRLEAVGAELRPMPQADFGSFHLAEYKRFGDIIRKNNIKLD